jgi:hypothetical protein
LKNLAYFNLYIPHSSVYFEKGSSEREEAFERLYKSDCIILYVSAEMIKGIINGNFRCMSYLRTCNFILSPYLKEKLRFPAIVFIITKANMLKENEIVQGIDGLRDKWFPYLFHKASKTLVMFVPVSLGTGLSSMRGNISGEISPRDVHLPIIFAIYSALNEASQKSRDNIELLRNDVYNIILLLKSGCFIYYDGEKVNF